MRAAEVQMASTDEVGKAALGDSGCQYERLPSPGVPQQGCQSQAADGKGDDAESTGPAVASKPLLRVDSCASGPAPPGCASWPPRVDCRRQCLLCVGVAVCGRKSWPLHWLLRERAENASSGHGGVLKLHVMSFTFYAICGVMAGLFCHSRLIFGALVAMRNLRLASLHRYVSPALLCMGCFAYSVLVRGRKPSSFWGALLFRPAGAHVALQACRAAFLSPVTLS